MQFIDFGIDSNNGLELLRIEDILNRQEHEYQNP